jgi:hypothetical protein
MMGYEQIAPYRRIAANPACFYIPFAQPRLFSTILPRVIFYEKLF